MLQMLEFGVDFEEETVGNQNSFYSILAESIPGFRTSQDLCNALVTFIETNRNFVEVQQHFVPRFVQENIDQKC